MRDAPLLAIKGTARCLLRRAGCGHRLTQNRFGKLAFGNGAEGNHFHRLSWVGVGKALLMCGVEALDQFSQCGCVWLVYLSPGYKQFERLPQIAHISRDEDFTLICWNAILR